MCTYWNMNIVLNMCSLSASKAVDFLYIVLWDMQIQELVGGLDTSTSFAAFDKMEEKVLSLEAEAESTAVLIGSDSLEGKFKELEGGSVNDELAQYSPRSLLLVSNDEYSLSYCFLYSTCICPVSRSVNNVLRTLDTSCCSLFPSASHGHVCSEP